MEGSENTNLLTADQTGSAKKRGSASDLSKENRTTEKPAKLKRVTEPPLDFSVMDSTPCCVLFCLMMMGVSYMSTAVSARDDFQAMKMGQQTQWIFDYLRTHSSRDMMGKVKYTFILGCANVCSHAWRRILGISRNRLSDLKRRFEAGHVTVAPVKAQSMLNTHIVKEWLSDFINKHADKMPDCDKLHLPSCLTKQAVYEMYESYCMDKDHTVPVSQSYFYRIWIEDYNNVTIPKVSRFAKCDICEEIKRGIMTAKTQEEKALWIKYREDHLNQQKAERTKYYKHRRKSILEPNKYMSIILDGMDQKKTYIPRLLQVTKATQSMWRLRTHVTGVLVHGQMYYGYFDYGQYEHSSNLTLTVLINTLYMYRDSLPDTLYLQMDNCPRENKNQYVLAFCCLLVELKVFKKIKLGFLMVGHTHEDVDQFFSRFSCRLQWNSANTIPAMMKLLEESYTPRPTSITVDKIFKVKEWLSPYIEKISYHAGPHQFKITLNESDKAVLFYKKWSSDGNWEVCDGDKTGILLKSLPPGKPDTEYYDPKKIEGLDINRIKNDYKSISKKMMSVTENRWWENFIDEVENLEEHSDDDEYDDDVPLAAQQEWRLPAVVAAKMIAEPTEEVETNHITVNLPAKVIKEKAPIPAVVIGSKKSIKTTRRENPLAVGDMCLLDSIEYNPEELQIAKVLSISGDSIEVQWYQGSVNSKIKPFMLQKKGKGITPWTQVVHRNTIWHHGFSLTKTGLLATETRRVIQEYKDY